MDISIVDISTVIGILFFFFTAITAVIEFRRQGSQKRAEFFFEKVNDLWSTDSYKKIMTCLDLSDHEALRSIPHYEKMAFLDTYEEIAFLMNSGLIRKEVASYMFGYYAIACWESDPFWNVPGLNKEGKYWNVFRNFIEQMKEYDSSRYFGEKNMRL